MIDNQWTDYTIYNYIYDIGRKYSYSAKIELKSPDMFLRNVFFKGAQTIYISDIVVLHVRILFNNAKFMSYIDDSIRNSLLLQNKVNLNCKLWLNTCNILKRYTENTFEAFRTERNFESNLYSWDWSFTIVKWMSLSVVIYSVS